MSVKYVFFLLFYFVVVLLLSLTYFYNHCHLLLAFISTVVW